MSKTSKLAWIGEFPSSFGAENNLRPPEIIPPFVCFGATIRLKGGGVIESHQPINEQTSSAIDGEGKLLHRSAIFAIFAQREERRWKGEGRGFTRATIKCGCLLGRVMSWTGPLLWVELFWQGPR